MVIVSTGFFDGVHLGHRLVVNQLVKTAEKRGAESVIATFWPHPRAVLQSDARVLRLLTSRDEKLDILKGLGVDRVEVLPFTREFSRLSTEQYLSEYVRDRLGGEAILLGYDNRMGFQSGPPEETAVIATRMGMEVIMVRRLEALSGVTVSSTKIREYISAGEMRGAADLLGYRYMLHGVVVAGNRMGRRLGFPTANMQLYEPLKLIPANGAYFVEADTVGRHFHGMCNIGLRPTVGAGNARTIETHIFDFDEDIYGLDISIRFISRIRSEERFDSLEALSAQLARDKALCLTALQ